MDQTQFLDSLLRSVFKSEEFPDNYRNTARAIRNAMLDSALMEGKIQMDDLPPSELDDD